MPSYQEIDEGTTLHLHAVHPVVTVDGSLYTPDVMSVLSAERRMGTTPGRAMLRFDTSLAQKSPRTLNAQRDAEGYNRLPTFGSRIRIEADGIDLWRGWLTTRQDSGDRDTVLWTALEDQWLLSKVFLRGAMVYDPTDQVVKYAETFTPTLNPGGLWNCMRGPVTYWDAESSAWKAINCPVFAPYAKKLMNYETPENTDVGVEANGQYCAWTPRRFLLYMQVMFQKPFQLPGIGFGPDGYETPLVKVDYNTLAWYDDSIMGMIGYDAANPSTTDPLDRKMPEMNLQGWSYAAALRRVLDVSGTHDLALEYYQDEDGLPLETRITFVPVGWSGDEAGDGRYLEMPRAGTPEKTEVATTFELSEDISNYAEEVIVDGAVAKVETALKLEVDSSGAVQNTSTIVPAWTAAEELAFKQCIYGAESFSSVQGEWALYPRQPGLTNFADLVPANHSTDGSVQRPSAVAKRPGAVQLAMQSYPTVFRAFRIRSDRLGDALDGYDDRYATTQDEYGGSRYIHLGYSRPILPTQLQFLLHDLGLSATEQGNQLRGYLPLRISVKLGDYWHDVQVNAGVRVTGDGMLWLDNLGPQAFPNVDCILGVQGSGYSGGADWYNPFAVILRSFRINAAVPMDARVTGRAIRVNGIDGEAFTVSDRLRAALGGPVQLYVDSGSAYQEGHQVNSEPTASAVYVGGASADEPLEYPLNRLVPPGSEKQSANYAAQRKLRHCNAPRRESSWTLPGINLAWAPGDFVAGVKFLGTDVTEAPYMLKAAIPRVLYDFDGQKTVLGGLYSDIAMQGA